MYKHREKSRRYKVRKTPPFRAKKLVSVCANTAEKKLNDQDMSLSQSKSDSETSSKKEKTSSKKTISNFKQTSYHKKSFGARVVRDHPLVCFINIFLFALILIMVAAFLINPELASVNNNDTVESDKTDVGVENDINISVTDNNGSSIESPNEPSDPPNNSPSNLTDSNKISN